MLRLMMAALAVLLPAAMIPMPALADGGPTLDRAWARATPGSAKVSAAYLRIQSPVDDKVIAVTSPVARKTELHTHVEENGVMQMHVLDGGLAVSAGQPTELQPGKLVHIMLIDLKKPLKAGDSFPLTLVFEKAGSREVTVSVERLGAMGPVSPQPRRRSAAPSPWSIRTGAPLRTRRSAASGCWSTSATRTVPTSARPR